MSKKIKEYVAGFTQDPATRKIERVAAYVRVSTQEQKLHGLSLAKMSKLFEIPKRTIESWETGERKPLAYVEKLIVEKLMQMSEKNKGLDITSPFFILCLCGFLQGL